MEINSNDLIRYMHEGMNERGGCGGPMLFGLLMMFLCAFMICSCTATKSVESNTEYRHISELTDRMDSLVRSTYSWQQDIYNRQSSLVDSIREKERNDSSHVVVINEKGDTVRERIEIVRYIEREHNTESKESEVVVHLQSQVDSLVSLCAENRSLTDSLLKSHDKQTVVEKELSWWQKVKMKFSEWIIGILLFIILCLVLRSKFRKSLP